MAIRKNSHNLFSAKTNAKVRKKPGVKTYARTAGGWSAGDPRKGAKGVAGGNLRRAGRALAEGAPGNLASAAAKSPKKKAAGAAVGLAGQVHGSYKAWTNQVKRQNKGRATRVTKTATKKTTTTGTKKKASSRKKK